MECTPSTDSEVETDCWPFLRPVESLFDIEHLPLSHVFIRTESFALISSLLMHQRRTNQRKRFCSYETMFQQEKHNCCAVNCSMLFREGTQIRKPSYDSRLLMCILL